MQALIGFGFRFSFLIYIGIIVALVSLVTSGWIIYGRGPRRRRCCQRALRLLETKRWPEALDELRQLQALGLLSQPWQTRVRKVEGECHYLAGEAALRDKQFESGLESLLKSARLLDREEAECRARVVQETLAEIRRCFAADSSSSKPSQANATTHGSIPELVNLVNRLQSPCAEVSFWQGLWHVREGRFDLALVSLEESRLANGQQVFDPFFYLGALLFREGRIAEALRHLADANRIAPECPLVPWQLGIAMVAEGGKDSLALRPLQKALGPNGLSAWIKSPRKFWQEALPDRDHSYVRRLAEELPYSCPVLGADIGVLHRQGQTALAQAQYRLGNYAEAADLFEAILRESPPTLPILRGLGISLARLQRFDEAFKHLRAAFDLEQNRDLKGASAVTAAYLALCGARGTPSHREDKSKNIIWAIRTLAAYDPRGDLELVQVWNAVFAEARSLGLSVPATDQVRLCDVLASIDAIDPSAAAAYYQLSASSPNAFRPDHARLYCRAVEQHHIENSNDLKIFQRAFSDDTAIRNFFQNRGWDLEEVEYVFATRCAAAEKTPSGAANTLPDYLREKVESFLLARSERLEQAGRSAEALASVDILLRLMPESGPAYDRLARLRYRAGQLDTASQILATWHEHDLNNYLPLIRKAVVDQNRGRADECLKAVDQALQRSKGSLRGSIAALGGRLALKVGRLEAALELFSESLHEDPGETRALWCSAATRYLLGDRTGLAEQATKMDRPDVDDPRFHYSNAVAYLAAGKLDRAVDAARRAATFTPWTPNSAEVEECNYLVARVHLARNDVPAATVELQRMVNSPAKPPSADHARAILARIRFSRDFLDEAIQLWRDLDEYHRINWQLDEPLQRTTFLAAVQFLKAGRYDQAARHLRELSGYEIDDYQYSDLLTHALAEAGRKCFSEHDHQTGANFLAEAIGRAGSKSSEMALDLALVYKHQGRISEARRVLQNVADPDAYTFFQLGLLSLEEKKLAQAEKEFTRAWGEDPNCFQSGYNLFLTRLSLGEVGQALDLLPNLLNLAHKSEDRKLFTLVNEALRTCPTKYGQPAEYANLPDVTPEEEQHLLELAHNLGHPPTAVRLLSALSAGRPEDALLRATSLEAVLLQAKQLLERCDWNEAARILTPWVEAKDSASRPIQAALLNLLGCCACMSQDFPAGIHYFTSALQLINRDARLSQNLALAYEFQGRLSQAEPHWNWYLEMLDGRIPAPADFSGYKDRLAFECLHRLAVRFSDKGNATSALTFLQRAHQLRPEDTDTLERLFHVLNQLKRPEDARRALRRLRQLRPQEPQTEWFELELIEINNLDNCNRVLAGMEELNRKYPDDGRLAERQAQFIAAITSYMKRLSRQMSEQLERAEARVRRLPSYQVDWPEMRRYLRELRSRMARIKKTAGRALPLAVNDLQRRNLQELIRQTEHEIERCKTLV